MIRVRFAPSPTGHLHVGNIFIALQNWLFARAHDGEFILRLDDTDVARSTETLAQAIIEDLRWLTLDWQRFERQTLRTSRYVDVAELLKREGRLYPCYESAEELALKRKSQLARGEPPVYDRAALRLTPAERHALEVKGLRPHWRFKLEGQAIHWNDLVRGHQHIDERSQSDPVLIREDGTFLYTLPSVIDDSDFGVTHVIRGNDHVTNTATQIQIFAALGASIPKFGHLPLVVDASGEGLSKRLGSLSIGDLRAEGWEPLAIAAYLAQLGSGRAPEPVAALAALGPVQDLTRFGKGSPRFDARELAQLNAAVLHRMDFSAFAARLSALGLAPVSEALWHAARPNLVKIIDIQEWQRICEQVIAPCVTDDAYLKTAQQLLPPPPWTTETWPVWTARLKERTGRKGKDLFLPLRLALTGQDHGPEMKHLLPLLSAEKVARRLEGQPA
ncbi:MAG TPA: glutamate--tRNA ligase [Dongiaceae bacterium]|nr:glutamate--tRNA ligase [Dongiaceae bacterium]